MRVLLIGEYSNVYTELRNELQARNIEAFSISDGDSYKNYPTDLLVKNPSNPKNLIQKVCFYLAYRLGLSGILVFRNYWPRLKGHIENYDVVQLINPVALSGFGSVANILFIKYIAKHNSKIFLSVLGDDYYTLKWFKANDHKSTYYKQNLFKRLVKPDWAFKYQYCLFYRYLNKLAVRVSTNIIPGLYCYRMPYLWTNKTTNVVPFPINKMLIKTPITLDEKAPIVIFHGWQKGREEKKGNDVFDRVIKRVVKKYGPRVEYNVVQNIPYPEYIRLYEAAHIFIDQLYFFDKGYNGLLGMAAGKVVFSGFSKDSLESYPKYDGEIVGVDASIDEDSLFHQFCQLIDDPQQIQTISNNAIQFVKNNHDVSFVLNMYIEIWRGNIK